MKTKWIVFAALALLLLSAGIYFWGPSAVPPGQRQLSRLSSDNFADFASAFDAEAEAARLILLVSPT